MATNNRVIWATQAVGFSTLGQNVYTAAHGVQSVGVTTTFNLTPVFELGQSAIYENIEGIPDIEVTMEKVLDGYPLLLHLGTKGSTTATLFGRQNTQCSMALSVFPDTNDSASGAPIATVIMSGLFWNSSTFTFPADGNFTEQCSFVGFNKIYKVGNTATFSGGFTNADVPYAYTQDSGGVQQRQEFLFDPAGVVGLDSNNQSNAGPTTPCTILPPDIAGISTSGVNMLVPGTTNYQCSISNISTSVNLNREAVNELGHKAPYYRAISLPVEVTTTIDVINKSGDWVSATEAGVRSGGDNTRLSTIKLAVKEGTFIDLGTQNRLASVNQAGGEAGGGNGTLSYTFNTYNTFTVYADHDVTSAIAQ